MLWRGWIGRDGRLTGIYARWHMFEEKREAVMAIEAAVLPLMPKDATFPSDTATRRAKPRLPTS
jgi:hypothetical protein